MTPEQIERVQQEYIDKYVVVDGRRPELARFDGHVGLVKTVNMNGRALVEFLDYHRNGGWHDIELDYLKVVDKPAAKKPRAADGAGPAVKRPAPTTGPTAGRKLSPLEKARMQGPAKKKAGGPGGKAAKKQSVADILAAARAAKGTGDTKAAAKQGVGKTSDQPPTNEQQPVATTAKKPRGKTSVADILAAARAEKGGGRADDPAGERAAPKSAGEVADAGDRQISPTDDQSDPAAQ